MAYKNQVGGRAEIIKVFGDHLLKPTTFYEVESYLKMSRSIADIAPDCCYIFSFGKVISLKKCTVCSDPMSMKTINLLFSNQASGHYLLMKDEAHAAVSPRILDLKLGTRTHSDYISEEKKINHIKKSLSTTTAVLGLRLSGASFGRGEVKWTKEDGKRMNAETFKRAMKHFFDVSQPKKNAAKRQLLKIKASLKSNENTRFFGSSLLVIIDDDVESPEASVKVKLIDFASMARSEYNAPQYKGADVGALLGVTNLLQILN